MQFDDKYIDKPDDFSRKIGEKVRNHTLTVDSSIWETIEEKLTVKKRLLTPWIWIAAGVAAALIGVILLFNPLQGESEEKIVAQDVQTEESATAQQDISDKNAPNEFAQKETSQPLFAIKSDKTKLSGKKHQTKVSGNTPTTNIIADYLDEQQNKTEIISEDEIVKHDEPQVQEEERKEKETSPTLVQPTEKEHEILITEDTRDKKERKLSLLASVNGAAGNVNTPFTVENNFYTDAPLGYDKGHLELNSSAGGYASTLKPSDYSDIRHAPPISFSILTGFPLSKTWSVETGLMYTYMASHFARSGNVTYRGKLGLHYLGIPVNLKATFLQNQQWNMYVLGGGSIEKGIFSLYRQEIEYPDGTIKHTNVRSRIDGVQTSAHAAIGFGYNINNKIQLFGEPRIVYYFNNNQPMSARTENPFTFGLNAGIKINF